MWLIVGLGNPGSRYRLTRHNLGFLVLDVLADRHRIAWKERRGFAVIGRGTLGGQDFMLVKPQTFMNNSGEVVSSLVRKGRVAEECLLVVHDDLDLPFGAAKIKRGGGPGGHKGIASIQGATGMEGFLRVKLGIGRPVGSQNPEEYVLSPFSREQQEVLPHLLERSSEAVASTMVEGAARAMNRFNKREDARSPGDDGPGG